MTTNKYPPIDPEEAVHRVFAATAAITNELRNTVIGQDHALEQILITLFAGGHCVLRGIPGSGKTLAVEILGRMLGLKFSRIPGTPDLSPDDVIGGITIIEDPITAQRTSKFVEGPVFANLVLAHEINRTPYKTQMAMLQTLQDLKVIVAGELHTLASPFFFVATINPTEQADVFPLTDALSDRFLMTIPFPCPNAVDERRIVDAGSTNHTSIRQILRPRDVLWIQKLARQIPASKHAIDYATDLVRATRPDQSTCPAVVGKWVEQGAGPHAAACLIMAAKARALMKGRCAVHAADIRAVLPSILLHRLHLRQTAIDEGITTQHVVEWLIKCVPEHSYGEPTYMPPELLVIDNAENLPPTVEADVRLAGPATVAPVPQQAPTVPTAALVGSRCAEPMNIPQSNLKMWWSVPFQYFSPQILFPYPSGPNYGAGQIASPYSLPVPYPQRQMSLPQRCTGESSHWPLSPATTAESPYELHNPTSVDRAPDMSYALPPILPTPCEVPK